MRREFLPGREHCGVSSVPFPERRQAAAADPHCSISVLLCNRVRASKLLGTAKRAAEHAKGINPHFNTPAVYQVKTGCRVHNCIFARGPCAKGTNPLPDISTFVQRYSRRKLVVACILHVGIPRPAKCTCMLVFLAHNKRTIIYKECSFCQFATP